MARPINPDDPGTDPGTPGTPGYIPPTRAGTKLAVTVTGTSVTFTSDQIKAAGGPWASFTIRVTPFNAGGSGPPASVTISAPPAPTP